MSLSSEGSKEVRRLRYEIIRRRDRAEDRQVPTSTHPGDKRHRDPTLTSTFRTLDLAVTEEQVETLSFNMEVEAEDDTDLQRQRCIALPCYLYEYNSSNTKQQKQNQTHDDQTRPK